MSASSKINESPSHFMVLEAIARGIDSIDKISDAVRKNKDEVTSIVNDLVIQRLATMVEKRRFFGGKKVKITITETGKNLLGIKHEELKQNKQKLEQLYESGDKAATPNLYGLEQKLDALHVIFWVNECIIFHLNDVLHGNGNDSIRKRSRRQ